MSELARIAAMSASEAIAGQSSTPAAVLDAKVQYTVELLRAVVRDHRNVVYANSLGAESVVLTDLIWTQVPQIEIFSIDTGRLHEETYQLLERLERRYQRRVRLYYPDPVALEAYVAAHGINGFYQGLAERQSCCHIRKVEPFRRAIEGAGAWVTGVRHEQSAQRAQAQPVDFDAPNGLYKISPILDWTNADVWTYIRSHKLAYSPLHDQGYPSIGCAPCTRAVEPGADSRSGRWWWENSDSKECGLHPRIRVVSSQKDPS
jgi:phosphoadenosine phosphosulfate reductase